MPASCKGISTGVVNTGTATRNAWRDMDEPLTKKEKEELRISNYRWTTLASLFVVVFEILSLSLIWAGYSDFIKGSNSDPVSQLTWAGCSFASINGILLAIVSGGLLFGSAQGNSDLNITGGTWVIVGIFLSCAIGVVSTMFVLIPTTQRSSGLNNNFALMTVGSVLATVASLIWAICFAMLWLGATQKYNEETTSQNPDVETQRNASAPPVEEAQKPALAPLDPFNQQRNPKGKLKPLPDMPKKPDPMTGFSVQHFFGYARVPQTETYSCV